MSAIVSLVNDNSTLMYGSKDINLSLCVLLKRFLLGNVLYTMLGVLKTWTTRRVESYLD